MDKRLPRDDFTARDSDVDGRPSVGWYDDDPLLERLCRYHPELMPPKLIKQLATNQRREPIHD